MRGPELGGSGPPPDNRAFCILPWTSLHVATNGDVLPCCIAAADQPFGSTRSQSLDDIWNAAPMRALRLRMLQGQTSRLCEKCYELEATGSTSLRQVAAADFAHHAPAVAGTRDDGSVAPMRIAFLDVRFSNVCNFSCRTCEPRFSTAWYPYVKDGDAPRGVIRPKATAAALLEEIQPHLEHVEQVYFAGGEPALVEEHYRVLERLIEIGRTDVRLSYSTNFSVLRFRRWDLLELWRRFERVEVGASLDGSGRRGEYLRHGQRWADVVENRRRLLAECPHVSFVVSSTLSNLNCLHLPDFHEEWAALGLTRPSQVFINILQVPAHFRLTCLPEAIKARVRARYADHLAYLRAQPDCDAVLHGYLGALRFMDSQDSTDLLPELRRVIAEQDERRREVFGDVFSELRDLTF